MAKGDNERAQGEIKYQTNLAQNHLDNLRGHVLRQNYGFGDQLTDAMTRQKQDYGDIMGQFNEFSRTGGYSEQDKSAIRNRAGAPIRAAYASANRDVDRNLARQGGYVPGYNAAKSRLARESSYAMSDAATNAEAQLAQMINQGRQFGTSGAAGLYGTTPGMWNMAANNLLNSTGQMLGVEGLQGDIGRTAIQGRIGAAQIPGKNQQMFGNIKSGFEFGKDILGGWL